MGTLCCALALLNLCQRAAAAYGNGLCFSRRFIRYGVRCAHAHHTLLPHVTAVPTGVVQCFALTAGIRHQEQKKMKIIPHLISSPTKPQTKV